MDFRLICATGDIEAARNFVASSTDRSDTYISIHSNFDEPFYLACSNGHLELVKWLWSIRDTWGTIDIHSDSDRCLYWSMTEGHAHIAQYLLELSIQIGKPFDFSELIPAICFCGKPMLQYLVDNAHLNISDHAFQLVFYSIFNRHPDILAYVLSFKCVIDFSLYSNVLMRDLFEYEYYDQVKLLIEYANQTQSLISFDLPLKNFTKLNETMQLFIIKQTKNPKYINIYDRLQHKRGKNGLIDNFMSWSSDMQLAFIEATQNSSYITIYEHQQSLFGCTKIN